MPLGSRRAGRASRFDVFNGTTEIPPRTLLLLLRDADRPLVGAGLPGLISH
jgi:hypothetical protein